MDRNEEGNNSAIYRISSPTNADGAKRSPEKPNASALRKNSSGKLQNPNSSRHLINVCYVNIRLVHVPFLRYFGRYFWMKICYDF